MKTPTKNISNFLKYSLVKSNYIKGGLDEDNGLIRTKQKEKDRDVA